MKSILFSCSLFLVAGLAATARPIPKESLRPELLLQYTLHIDTVVSKVDVRPSFKGGADAWVHFVKKNLNGDVPVLKVRDRRYS